MDSEDEEDKVKVIELLDDRKNNEDNEQEEIEKDSSDDEIKTSASTAPRRSKRVDITKDVAKGSGHDDEINDSPVNKDGKSDVDDTDADVDEEDDEDEDACVQPTGDVDHDEVDEDDADNEYDDDSVVEESDAGDEDEFVPDNCIFASYFCFILWGPLAERNKQLTLFLPGEMNLLTKSGVYLL